MKSQIKGIRTLLDAYKARYFSLTVLADIVEDVLFDPFLGEDGTLGKELSPKIYWALFGWSYAEGVEFPKDNAIAMVSESIFTRSGEKFLSSSFWMNFMMYGDDHPSQSTETKFNSVIGVMLLHVAMQNASKWARLAKALYADYNPIDNYAMTEKTQIERSDTDELTHGKTVSQTDMGNDTVVETPRVSRGINVSTGVDTSSVSSGNIERQVSAFNSSEYEPKEKQVNNNVTTRTQGSASENFTYTREDAPEGQNTTVETTSDTHSIMEGGKDVTEKDGTEKIEHERSGNIGVTTTAQMIEGEFAMRAKNEFWEVVFKDIEKEMFLGVY